MIHLAIYLKRALTPCLLLGGLLATMNRPVVMASVQTPVVAPAIIDALPADPPPTPSAVVEVRSQRKQALDQYVVGAMRSWTPAVKQVPTVDYDALAGAIVDAVSAHDPAWADDKTGARSMILLAALAYWEGARFAAYVADGRCNDREWRKSPEGVKLMKIGGNCDSGKSFSLFQIQSLGGTLDGLPIDPDNLIGGLEFPASVALMKARSSLRAKVGLCYYAGERPWKGCPKAQRRLDFADNYWRKHPFSVDTHAYTGVE